MYQSTSQLHQRRQEIEYTNPMLTDAHSHNAESRPETAQEKLHDFHVLCIMCYVYKDLQLNSMGEKCSRRQCLHI